MEEHTIAMVGVPVGCAIARDGDRRRSSAKRGGTPQGRKIATNNFGSREMSAKLMLSLSFSSGRWCTHILSHLLGLKVDHWLCYNAFLQLTAPLP
jgi:hypothetical protein